MGPPDLRFLPLDPPGPSDMGLAVTPGDFENPGAAPLAPFPPLLDPGPYDPPLAPPPPAEGEGNIIYGVDGQWIRLRPGHSLGEPPGQQRGGNEGEP